MDDTLQKSHDYFLALELGKLLNEHKGADVVVMDMRPLGFWTDFFVIATVSSSTHLMGLDRHIKDFTREKGIQILRHSSKGAAKTGRLSPAGSSMEGGSADQRSDEWQLLDLGTIVIHLMTARTRSFFELERLWSAAPLIYKAGSYSSKSS